MSREDELLKAVFSATTECPPVEDILDGAGRGDTRILGHVSGCPRCAAEVALYHDFVNMSQRVGSGWWAGFQGQIQSWLRSVLRPVILTPAAAALATILLVVAVTPRRTSPVLDDATRSGVERSQTVEMVSPAGDVTKSPAALRWSPVPGVVRYRVKLLEVDRNILWSAETAHSEVSLPAPIQKKILPGKRLIWTVEAIDSKGQTAAAGTQDFRKTIEE